MMKHISIYIVFVISAILILANRMTAFYISDYRLHFIILFLAASTFVIIVGHLFRKLRSNRSIAITFVIVGVLCFLKAFFSWGGDWKTEAVLYTNIEDSRKSIDLQLRGDRFSFGYKKRVVEIYKILPGMMWTTDADTTALDSGKWVRTDSDQGSL